MTEAPVLTVHVYRMDDCDHIAATSLEEAKRYYLEIFFGGDPACAEDAFDDPYERSPEEMEEWQFLDIEGEYGEPGATMSFRAALAHMLAAGDRPPFFFSTTEY